MATFKEIHSSKIEIGQVVYDSDEETMLTLVKRDEDGDPWFKVEGANQYCTYGESGLCPFGNDEIWLEKVEDVK